MDLLSELSQLVRFLKEQVHIYRPQFHAPCSRMMAGFDVSRTEIVNFVLPSHIDFLFSFGDVEIIVNKMFLKRKVWVTERPRSALSLFRLKIIARALDA